MPLSFSSIRIATRLINMGRRLTTFININTMEIADFAKALSQIPSLRTLNQAWWGINPYFILRKFHLHTVGISVIRTKMSYVLLGNKAEVKYIKWLQRKRANPRNVIQRSARRAFAIISSRPLMFLSSQRTVFFETFYVHTAETFEKKKKPFLFGYWYSFPLYLQNVGKTF